MSTHDMDPQAAAGEPQPTFQLDVRAHGFDLTDALRQYASDHLAAKLSKHARQIQSVVIRLGDVNGTKGGEDKVCEIEVHMPGHEAVVVSATNHDLRAAIDLVSNRVQTALSRVLGRGRALPRQRGRKVVRARKVLH